MWDRILPIFEERSAWNWSELEENQTDSFHPVPTRRKLREFEKQDIDEMLSLQLINPERTFEDCTSRALLHGSHFLKNFCTIF